MRRSLLVLAIVPFAITACSGPQKPLNIGVKNLATSFHYGLAQAAVGGPNIPGAAPAPPMGPLAPIGTVTWPDHEAPLPPPVVVPPRVECPTASTIAVVKKAATNTIAKPPVKAVYGFHSKGTWADTSKHSGVYPTTQLRGVTNPKVVNADTGEMTFDVITLMGSQLSGNSFHYVPPTAASRSAAGAQPIAGLYLTRDVRQENGKTTSRFVPQGPGLLLLEAPATPGNVWQSTASDASSGITEFITATIQPPKLVDACGEVIQTIPVHYDGRLEVYQPGLVPKAIDPGTNLDGQQASPSGVVTFTADYYFATQYGGLIVQDVVKTEGSIKNDGLKASLTATINSLPIAP